VNLFKKAYYFVRDQSGAGKEILFVGTKKQVQTTIAEEAKRCGAHYVNRRWLGGTLTNFVTIKKSIKRMKDLETMIEDGSIDHFPNKEATRIRRQLAKLQRNLDGLRHLERVPDIMYVIDPDVEANAVREANALKIPVLAMVDTNCDPDPIDFPIPGNDDAIKATKLITSRIADAVLEGREGHQEEVEEAISAEEPKKAEEEAPSDKEKVVSVEATVEPEEVVMEEETTTEEEKVVAEETAEKVVPTEAPAESEEEAASEETAEVVNEEDPAKEEEGETPNEQEGT
jgi:small subunit ribosomal protein S2